MNYKDTSWKHFDISYLKTFKTEVPVFSPSCYYDLRGEIFTTFHSDSHPITDLIDSSFVIHNRFSKSYKNVLRGLHGDNKTYKLVQAVAGDIYLVVLDIRKNSETYGKWESYILSDKTHDQVLVPPGFANGHYALTDCIFHYTMLYKGEYVDETKQDTIKHNDPRYNIEWPTNTPILQGRDK